MLQADAEKTEVEEVTRPRDSVLVRLGDMEGQSEGRVPHLVTGVPPLKMDHVFLESHGALGLLCSDDSHLILALDSKSVQCVCDIYTLR